MFNDIFGEMLCNYLIVDKPPDPGEMQAKKNGNFLMKCCLLRIFNFFLKCRIVLFLGTRTKYIKFVNFYVDIYYKQGVPNKNLE